jgi:hypothetical protein
VADTLHQVKAAIKPTIYFLRFRERLRGRPGRGQQSIPWRGGADSRAGSDARSELPVSHVRTMQQII